MGIIFQYPWVKGLTVFDFDEYIQEWTFKEFQIYQNKLEKKLCSKSWIYFELYLFFGFLFHLLLNPLVLVFIFL